MAIKQYIIHRNTFNMYLDRANLRERCEIAAKRCCLSLQHFRHKPPDFHDSLCDCMQKIQLDSLSILDFVPCL